MHIRQPHSHILLESLLVEESLQSRSGVAVEVDALCLSAAVIQDD